MADSGTTLSYDTRVACVFCATSDSARIGIDRRGRPYLVCGRCGARTFMPSRMCLDGYGLLAPVLLDLMTAMRSNDALRLRAEEGHATLIAHVERATARHG
jgi:transcription elongation factor Elf1